MAEPIHPYLEFLAGATARHARIIDLSHAIDANLPQWPGDRQVFGIHTESSIEKDGCFTRSFSMLEHYGTHLDAPAHVVPHGMAVDEIPSERLAGPAVVLDARDAVAADADYALAASQIERWEAAHGLLPAGGIVLLRTGWASRWADAAAYANSDAAATMHFPGFGADAVRILIERHAVGIGIDTMSVDPGNSRDFPVHQLALQAGLYQIENLADLSGLPEAGALLLVAPMKLKGGSGAPCRVFAILP